MTGAETGEEQDEFDTVSRSLKKITPSIMSKFADKDSGEHKKLTAEQMANIQNTLHLKFAKITLVPMRCMRPALDSQG